MAYCCRSDMSAATVSLRGKADVTQTGETDSDAGGYLLPLSCCNSLEADPSRNFQFGRHKLDRNYNGISITYVFALLSRLARQRFQSGSFQAARDIRTLREPCGGADAAVSGPPSRRRSDHTAGPVDELLEWGAFRLGVGPHEITVAGRSNRLAEGGDEPARFDLAVGATRRRDGNAQLMRRHLRGRRKLFERHSGKAAYAVGQAPPSRRPKR